MGQNKKILFVAALVLVFLFGFFALIQRSEAVVYVPTALETGLPDPAGGVGGVVKNILNWMLGLVGVIAIIGFVISGFQYITAAGSEKTLEIAKRNMTYSIIGVIVALSGYVIILAIDTALRGTSSIF